MTGTTLWINQDRWQRALDGVRDATAAAGLDLVPVAKGNGYGFELELLANEATRMGGDTLAVGAPAEIAKVADRFGGDIVVLTPWPDFDPSNDRAIPTVNTVDQLQRLAGSGARVLVEVQTSMRRHGIPPEELPAVGPLLDGLEFLGWTIHLPMGDTAAEAAQLAERASSVRPAPLWLSHVTDQAARQIASDTGQRVRLRRGTGLWLADPSAYQATSTVLDVHPVRRGERAGYWQRRVRADGWLVVIGGGSANGIAMQAPSAANTWRRRIREFGGGALSAAGRSLSPFTIDDRKRWFLEPPHMQTSLILLPADAAAPAIGSEVPVTVRMTTYLADRIVIE